MVLAQVKATILEALVTNHGVTFKEVKEALGVTRYQWEQADIAIKECASAKKQKATHGVKMSVKPETVKAFVDFCLRPDNIQDVAYGSRVFKVDDGTSFICPSWIRKSHRAKMIRAFKSEFTGQVEKMPSRTWMYKVMDWITKKDMVSLAGLDNTDVAGKQAMVGTAQLAETVMSALGKDMPPELRERVTEMRKEMEDCKTVLRQHLEDSMHPTSFVSSHCLNHCLNPTEGYACTHDHTECETCVKPFRALALVEYLITKVKDERQQKTWRREHDLYLKNIVLFMGHVVRSTVQRPMQDATLEAMGENSRLIVVDWAMKWLALYAREKQSEFYAKAGLNWHQLCIIDKKGHTNGMVQLLPEAKQTSWQVFNLFVHAVNDLKKTDPSVTGVIGQSDNAGCYHSLDLIIRLGLAGASGEMLVKVLKWMYSEAQDGKDVADRFIGTKKGHVEQWVKAGNDAATADQLCQALSEMNTLPGNHKTFVIQPTAAELESRLPFKGGKASNAKHFSLYHEIDFVYHPQTGAFMGLTVREQFQFGPSKFFPLESLLQMKKMEQLYGKGALHEKKIWVPPVTVFREAVHGSGNVEIKDRKSELGFYAQNQKKAHILRDEVESDPDCDYFGENKDTAESTEYVSDDDSDYNASDLCSEGTDLDVEDDLPFVCDICNKIFKTLGWFTKHMQNGVHKQPAVSMNEFVGNQVQFHVAQCKQITSMHFKRKRAESDAQEVPEPLQPQGVPAGGVPFKQGWARKQKRQRGVACAPEVKQFLRDCFLAAYDKDGKPDRATLISKAKAWKLLQTKMEEKQWPVEWNRTEQQIAGHYSQFKKIMLKKSRDALRQETFEHDTIEFENDSGSDEEQYD